jgi:hypothetical protein
LLASVRALSFARCWQPDPAPGLAFTALGAWLCLVADADAVACTADAVACPEAAVACPEAAVGCAPPPDDEAVTVPQPAVTAARRHAASPLHRKFI